MCVLCYLRVRNHMLYSYQCRAKTLSEWEAWAIHAQQTRWELVVINPAVVMGPPLAGIRGSEIIESTCKLLDGSSYPFVPPLGACWRFKSAPVGGSQWVAQALGTGHLLTPRARVVFACRPKASSLHLSRTVASGQAQVEPSPPPSHPPAQLTCTHADTPAVDIADVAAAHCLAMVLPCVKGRYIICERATLLTDVAAILQ